MSRMSFMTRMRPRAFRLSLAVFIIVILVAAPEAQQFQPTSYSADGAVVPTSATSTIDLLVGRSTVLNVTAPIARLSLTVPDVADAMVTSPQQILIHGKAPGTISMFVWDKAGAIRTYEVAVRRDLSVLSNQLRQLFPGEPIIVSGSGKDVVLSGRVSTPYIVEKAAEVAIAYADKKENVVNLLKMQEGVATNQVMLKVRFAEVSRSAVQELGASFVVNGRKNEWWGRTTTSQFPAPEWDQDGKLVFSDFLNLFVLNSKEGLGGVIKALSNKGLFQSLAEPNLVAMDGKEASFLAGGEFPFPVATPSNGGGYAVSIMFKEFGVRLNFTPTILGDDMVRLKVRPEVSALDFTNAVLTEGFRVPSLSTRRTETEVELQNGQTFAIAGLMNNTLTNTMSKIPGIGDIPILGLLFRSKAHQKNQTELVVMITPYIVRRGSHGVSAGVPNLVEPYLGAPSKSLPPPAPYTGSPRYGATQQGSEATIQPPQTSPAPAPSAKPGQVTPAAPKASKADAKRVDMERDRQQMERELEAKRRAEADQAAGKVGAQQQKAAAKAAAEKQRAEAKAAAEEQKRQESSARAALKKAAEEQEKLEAAAREQARKDATAAKKAAEDKKNAEDQQKKLAIEEAKRQKALAEAAAKTKEAQSAYEAVVRTTPGKPLR